MQNFLQGLIGLIFILLMIVPFMTFMIVTSIWHGAYIVLDFIFKINKIVVFIYYLSDVIGKYIFLDPRNSPLLPSIIWCSFWPMFLYSVAFYRITNYDFEIITFFAIHTLRLGPRYKFFAYCNVLTHKDGHCHKRLFKGPFKIFNEFVQYFIGPLYGVFTNSYPIAHNKLHHIYNNFPNDPHSNIDLDRSSFWSFFVYMPRFILYWTGINPARFLWRQRKYGFLKILVKGMVWHFGIIGVFAAINWKFSLAYLVWPILEDVVFIGSVGYLWHCFVDPDDPSNEYALSVTILEGHDNTFEEDYHVVHHADTVIHWTQYRKHYEDHFEEYKKHKATIFRDTFQLEILFRIITGQLNWLANHFVDLSGKMTHEQKKEFLLARLKKTVHASKCE